MYEYNMLLSVWSALCVLKMRKEEGWAALNSGQYRENDVGTKKRRKERKERREGRENGCVCSGQYVCDKAVTLTYL